MDDINTQISKVLSDPNSLAQIQQIMGSLGVNNSNNSQPNLSDVNNNVAKNELAISNNDNYSTGAQNNQQNNGNVTTNSDMFGALTKLAPLISQNSTNDTSANLLLALKPMLSAEKSTKIDEAIKVLSIIKMIPTLKDSGLLPSIFSGLF